MLPRKLGFAGIDETIVTFAIDENSENKMRTLYQDKRSGRVILPPEGLACILIDDDTVGFGSAATATDTDVFFGIIRTYDEDGFVGVQTGGYAQDVITKGAIPLGTTALLVNNAGLLSTSGTASTVSNGRVTKAAVTGDLNVTIKM